MVLGILVVLVILGRPGGSGSPETQGFFTTDVYDIEEDEAERRDADSLKPVL